MKNCELFEKRHIGVSDSDSKIMLKDLGLKNLEELIFETIPDDIRIEQELKMDEPLSEFEFIQKLKEIAAQNKIFRSYIGMGYYPSITPAVIQRNILENPGWYTQYTPYQAEISQGRLEALLNFQTVITELTKLPVANASLLDEATAAAEAVIMLNSQKKDKSRNKIFIADTCFPQTTDVVRTRSIPHKIEIIVDSIQNLDYKEKYFAILLQYPDVFGQIENLTDVILKAKENGIFVVVAADLLSLALLTSPGEMGADVVVGSTQRFGVPLGYGGPHAGYFAVKEEFKRIIPGRIIGLSIDKDGHRALRMALQTREQHIRREKATSNICTAQVLLAIMAGMYAVYHGPKGIKGIAERIHMLAVMLNSNLSQLGLNMVNTAFFDTLCIEMDEKIISKLKIIAEEKRINFNYFFSGKVLISLDERTTENEIEKITELFASVIGKDISKVGNEKVFNYLSSLTRTSNYLEHPVFNSYHSETEMLRYIKRLESRDLSLTASMIPLGSCTMKLNATTEMFGISWNEFADLHPFVPIEQAKGYQILIRELEKDLCTLTGFSAVSLQPNSGAQGEYAGLMVIRKFFEDKNEFGRNIVLIPASAHGTNPASAVLAGMKVVVINCDANGNIDITDLKIKAEQYAKTLAALMVTYPSTHGVFESKIREICKIVHDNGGQVYMDGANMNAQVGYTSPKLIGADVCHINLHKTFAIPHGGGGPGIGPIAVAEHLAPFLPGHQIIRTGGEKAISAVSASPWGSAGVLLISYAYIKMSGIDGLKKSTAYAILNANYLKLKLEKYFKVLYSGVKGRVAHELIFDVREFKHSTEVDVEDIAKRLMDYGFHAPTVSFPVAGTLMVEPTESESKFELDRFCEAMISIRKEIEEIENGKMDKFNNTLKNAPHTLFEVTKENWEHPYSREKAVLPTEFTKSFKFWPTVSRINNAHGDRNLVCSCEPVSAYVEK